MAIGINEIKPEIDAPLTTEWESMMSANAGKDEVEATVMIPFYNSCLMIVVGQEYDRYGLIGDLTMLLTIFNAELDPATKQLITIDPVPMLVLKSFELGYANGREITKR